MNIGLNYLVFKFRVHMLTENCTDTKLLCTYTHISIITDFCVVLMLILKVLYHPLMKYALKKHQD